MGFYWSYLLLLELPVLTHSCIALRVIHYGSLIPRLHFSVNNSLGMRLIPWHTACSCMTFNQVIVRVFTGPCAAIPLLVAWKGWVEGGERRSDLID